MYPKLLKNHLMNLNLNYLKYQLIQKMHLNQMKPINLSYQLFRLLLRYLNYQQNHLMLNYQQNHLFLKLLSFRLSLKNHYYQKHLNYR
jgi:hypothetical protein